MILSLALFSCSKIALEESIMEYLESLHIVPVTLQQANCFIAEHNGRYHAYRSHCFAIGCAADNELVGVVVVGRPSNKALNDGQTLAVSYIHTMGGRTAYGMLYSAAARAAKAMGHHRIIAFLAEDRPDSGLRAAGWKRAESIECRDGQVSQKICYEQRFTSQQRKRSARAK